MKKMLLACLLIINSMASASQITLNIKNASLPDAIRFIATSAGENVVIGSDVNGTVSLALENASAANALNSLLESNGLAKEKVGNVWYIAGKDELIKRKEHEMKWQDAYLQAESLIMDIKILRYAKAADVAQMLQNPQTAFISKRGKVQVDARTNTLLIQDVPENMLLIRKLISRLDVPVKQVMIEARLASVDTDFEQELGISFGVEARGQSRGQYSIAVVTLANGSQLDVKLSALQTKGHAELISAPRLFTANQQSASIESGEEVPYQEVSESGGTAVTFKKAVLGLKVTPQILPGNRVLLQLKINQDRPAARMVQGVPAISTRQMLTSVLIKNGETVVLGGIYEMNDENEERGLPFLSEIPVLGALFRTRSVRQNKRELLVFVRPEIIG